MVELLKNMFSHEMYRLRMRELATIEQPTTHAPLWGRARHPQGSTYPTVAGPEMVETGTTDA